MSEVLPPGGGQRPDEPTRPFVPPGRMPPAVVSPAVPPQPPVPPYPAAPAHPAQAQPPAQAYPTMPYAPEQPYAPASAYPQARPYPQAQPYAQPQGYPAYPTGAYPVAAGPYPQPAVASAPSGRKVPRGRFVTLMVGGTTLALAGAAALGVGVWDAVVRADALDDGAYAGEAVELAPQNEPTSLEGLYTELNTALATRDREAFFAHVEGDAVEPLTLWWDNMDALGWSTGVLAPYTTTNLTASGPQTEVYVTLGTDLTFPQHRPALSNGAVAGLVTFSGDYVMVVDTTGPRPVVSDWASGETVPWDTEPLVVVERDGVVVAGGADELAHLEVVADAAVEPSRWLRADQAARRGGEELGGFVVFATQDADRFAGWWGEGSDEWTWEPAGFARSGILPTAGTPGMDPQLATGSTEGGGVTFVGPEAGVVPEDLEVILVHEFAHVLQYVETPSAARSVPLSTSEGWASYQELRYVMGGEYPDDEPWFGDYLGECVEGEPTLPTDRDFEGDGADCAYLVSSTLFGFVEEEGADPLAVADRAARDGVTVFGGMQRLGTPVSDDAWSSWVAEVAD